MAERQHIEQADKRQIGALLRRIEAARNFPTNTDPCVRHVQIMGETLGAGHPYPMLNEERGHCAISLLSVVAALYEARNAAGVRACGSNECVAGQRDGVLCANGECDRENGVRPDGVATDQPTQQEKTQ